MLALLEIRHCLLGCACVLAMTATAYKDEVEVRTVPQQLSLPQTYDMKLAGDLSGYIRLQCSGFSTQCDVFVQGNPKGSLSGYLLVRQESNGSVYFESDSFTDDGRVCVILGNFDGARFNAMGDFEQRSSFQSKSGARDKDGGYLLKRVGESLRVQDEKWNYCCYEEKRIDDVWNLIGTARRH